MPIPIVLRMCIDSRTSVDADTCTDADARTYTHADAFLLLLTLMVSSLTFDFSFCNSYDSGIRSSLHCVSLTPTDVEIAVYVRSLLHRGPLPGLFEYLLNHTKYLSYGGRWISFVCGDKTPKGFSRIWVEESGNWIPTLLRAR